MESRRKSLEEMLCAYAGVHFPFILLFLSELYGIPVWLRNQV